jgi:DNA-binding NarL/FixJ family response regulator
MTATIALFLVDDHDVVRRGLRAYAEVVPDLEVVGEAASGEAAIDAIDELAAQDRLPSVVLMDLVLPGMEGAAATQELLRRHRDLRVVVLTSFGGHQRVQRALAAGATGFLLKNAEVDEVVEAVRNAARGEIHLDPTMVSETAGREPGIAALTTREREVLALLGAGCSNQQIADRLEITERTARTHVSNLLGKLQLGSRTQAALLAQREGLSPAAGACCARDGVGPSSDQR